MAVSNNILTDVEYAMSEVMWLALCGGGQKGTFRHVRCGIQGIKITGDAFLRSVAGEVCRVSGLEGHFHPAKTGGKKRFNITGIRIALDNNKGNWLKRHDVWQVLNFSIKETGFHHKEFGTYYVSVE